MREFRYFVDEKELYDNVKSMSNERLVYEEAIGQKNGINKTFRISDNHLPNTLVVYVNGIAKFPGLHFEIIDEKTFEMKTPPSSGSEVVASYVKR